MKKENAVLRLLPGAQLFHDDRGRGMRRDGEKRYALGAGQNAILAAMEKGSFGIEALSGAAAEAVGGTGTDFSAPIELAGFILDFQGFLENE
jgi:hypothetical protein